MCGCKVEREEVRGCLCEQRVFDSRAENLEIDNAKANGSLEEGCSYTFLGVLKNVKQEDRIVLQNEAKVYLQRFIYYQVYLAHRLPQSGCFETVCFTTFNVFHVDPDMATCRLTAIG